VQITPICTVAGLRELDPGAAHIGGYARVLPDCAYHLASQRGWHHLGRASPE